MKKAKVTIFSLLGIVLAVTTVLLSFWGRTAEPRLLMAPEGAAECCEAMLTKLCAGDYAGASQYLYGTPQLDSGRESETGAVIWDAFVKSLHYELVGESYATANGVGQKVKISSLQIPDVAGALSQRAQTLLEERVAAAENMDDVYNEDLEYQVGFVQEVLRDAAAQCATENGQIVEQELELNLVFDRNQWWVVPDGALLSAISGGILGNS